jgi:hypothetical protein
MEAFTPTVHRDFIRNALPGMQGRKVANVADDEIDEFIAAATRKVLREAGVPQSAEDKAEAEYIIKLYAKADTLERSLSEQSAGEVPLATSMRTRADTQLTAFDVSTSGEGEAERASKAANVRNLEYDDLGIFTPDDFGLTSLDPALSPQKGLWP